MISNRIRFRVSFPTIPTPVSDVWTTLTSYLQREKCLPKEFHFSQIAGHDKKYHSSERLALSAHQIGEMILSRDLVGFGVDTGYSERSVAYELSTMRNTGGQAVISCRIENKAKAPNDWAQLVGALMIQWPSIGAWQWNHQYLCWQDYCAIEGYQVINGEIPPNLRRYMEKNVSPYDKDREMVDISLNPGRNHQLLTGINFVPSAEMWLGPCFWQYAKCTKEEALAADFFIEKRDTPHFLYLKCWPTAFTRPDGEQGQVQQKLWKLFFHEDCEWPPGSGTICDEPMYGPPELMPKNA